jgi:hypothetical protein
MFWVSDLVVVKERIRVGKRKREKEGKKEKKVIPQCNSTFISPKLVRILAYPFFFVIFPGTSAG